jgi:hypothetical protein
MVAVAGLEVVYSGLERKVEQFYQEYYTNRIPCSTLRVAFVSHARKPCRKADFSLEIKN